jgi:hypothetical protein
LLILDSVGRAFQLLSVRETIAEGDLFRASYLEPLPFFDGLYKERCVDKRIVRSGIEPRGAASQDFRV